MKLTLPQVTTMKNPKYISCRNYWPYQVLKVWKHWIQNCGCDRMSNLLNCVLRWRHRDLETWPEMTWGQNVDTKCAKDKWIVVPSLAARRPPLYLLRYLQKTTGEHICAPGRAWVNTRTGGEGKICPPSGVSWIAKKRTKRTKRTK